MLKGQQTNTFLLSVFYIKYKYDTIIDFFLVSNGFYIIIVYFLHPFGITRNGRSGEIATDELTSYSIFLKQWAWQSFHPLPFVLTANWHFHRSSGAVSWRSDQGYKAWGFGDPTVVYPITRPTDFIVHRFDQRRYIFKREWKNQTSSKEL